jgi:hypothetical protein
MAWVWLVAELEPRTFFPPMPRRNLAEKKSERFPFIISVAISKELFSSLG